MTSTTHQLSSTKKRTANENFSDEITYEPARKTRRLNIRPLALAIIKKDIIKVKQFLTEQKNDYIPESNTDTPLHHAAEGGNMNIVKLLFNHGYGTVNAVNYQSKTPLQLAIKNNQEDVIKYLLENGAKSVLSPEELENFIRSYKKPDKVEILKCLIKGEIVSNYTINFVVEQKCLECLKCILEFGNVINEPPFFDFLHTAASNGNLEMVKLLFNNGFDVIGDKNDRQEIPLHSAVRRRHEEVVEFLMDNGAKNKLTFEEFNDLIKQSIFSKCSYIVNFLNSTHTISASVLNFAASKGHLEILKLLMENGVKIQSTSETPLQCAARHGHLEIVKYLIESGNSIIKSTDCSAETKLNSETPLHCATGSGHLDIVEYFIENGLFINKTKKSKGLTILELAVTKGHLKIVNYLLKKQAEGILQKKINGRNDSSLHYAASHGHLDILKSLIEYDADINVKTDNGTPLHNAVRSGHVAIVRELLELEAKELEVPKDILAENVKDEILTMLLNAGHSLEAYFGGRKPILIAAQLGYTKLVEALLSSGVDVNTKEKPHENALNLAVIARKTKVVNILLNAGALRKGPIVSKVKPLEYCIRKAYCSDDFETEIEILRNLLDHVQNKDLSQIVVSCINVAVREKAPMSIIYLLLDYDFNNNCELTSHCLRNFFYVFRTLLHHIEKIETLVAFQKLILQKFTRYCYEGITSAIVSRILFLKSFSTNFNFDKGTYLNFVKFFDLEKWCDQCQDEIDIMKETKILPGELDITYHDFLAKPIHRVANYVRNEKLVTKLYYHNFAMYEDFFNSRMSKAKNRSLLIDKSQKSLYNIILNGLEIHLPNEIIDKICEYLSVIHLERLQQAFP